MPVDRPPGLNRAGHRVRGRPHPDREAPGGHRARRPPRRSHALARLGRRSPSAVASSAAIDLAERAAASRWSGSRSRPGAKISRDSGTENMDWVARALRRIITFTQAGGEVNVVVAGINVGAQPYWNAEATMLMHTRGILVMTPDSAMVLTGKQALDYSGGVSAEDNFGIGGLRPDHGSRTGRPSTGRRISPGPARSCSPTTPTRTSPRASGSRAGPRPPTRSIATCATRRTRRPGTTFTHRGRDLLVRDERRAQEVRSTSAR